MFMPLLHDVPKVVVVSSSLNAMSFPHSSNDEMYLSSSQAFV